MRFALRVVAEACVLVVVGGIVACASARLVRPVEHSCAVVYGVERVGPLKPVALPFGVVDSFGRYIGE